MTTCLLTNCVFYWHNLGMEYTTVIEERCEKTIERMQNKQITTKLTIIQDDEGSEQSQMLQLLSQFS